MVWGLTAELWQRMLARLRAPKPPVSGRSKETRAEMACEWLEERTVMATDLGDALGTYGTPSHTLDTSTIYLGSSVDDDAAAMPTADATGDDLSGSDDEDGVAFGTFVQGQQASITVTVGGAGGVLGAWIDFNNNGAFDDSTEKITFTDPGGDLVVNGTNNKTFVIPTSATTGVPLIARFRLATDADDVASHTGAAADGEVEDYQITILGRDQSDAPLYAIADHAITGPQFGATVSNDATPFVSPDIDASDDGVTLSPLVQDRTASVTFNVPGGTGFVAGWIDWDGNGVFDSGEELTFSGGNEISAANTTLTFDVPDDAVLGGTYARFRIASTAAEIATPDGYAASGEVEDYAVTLLAVPTVVNVDSSFDGSTANFGYTAFNNITDALTMVSAGGTVNIEGGTYSEALVVDKDVTFNAAAAVTVTSFTTDSLATVQLVGDFVATGNFEFNGDVEFLGFTTLTTSGLSSTIHFNRNVVVGTNRLELSSSQTIVFNGPYTTTLNTLSPDTGRIVSDNNVTFQGGQTLEGTGIVSLTGDETLDNLLIDEDSYIRPGNSGTGNLSIRADLNLDGTLQVTWSADTSFTSLIIGTAMSPVDRITLGADSALEVTFGYTPLATQSATFIVNDEGGGNPIIGTFSGLAAASIYQNTTTQRGYRVNYSTGSNSNDFALIANTAPTLTAGSTALPSLYEGAAAPSNGDAVGTLVSSLITSASGADTNGNPLGVAIYSVLDPARLWYSTDDGATWTNASALGLSADVALLLAGATARVYYQPAAGSATALAQTVFTYGIWDQTAGTIGGTYDLATYGSGGSSAVSSTATVRTATLLVADHPSIDFDPASPVEFDENTLNSGAVALNAAADIVDTDSDNFAGGSLTISGFVDGEDQVAFSSTLHFKNDGGSLQYDLTGTGTFTLASPVVGTVSGGTGSTPLTITFSAAATTAFVKANVEELLRGITFRNTSETPTATRTLTVTLTDGDTVGGVTTGTNGGQSLVVDIDAENDSPTLTVVPDVTYTETAARGGPNLLDGTATFTDVDGGSYSGGEVEVTGVLAEDTISIATTSSIRLNTGDPTLVEYFNGTSWISIGTVTGGNGTTLTVTLTALSTPASVEALLQALSYQTSDSTPPSSHNLVISVTDPGGGAAVTATIEVEITAENDAPQLSGLTDPADFAENLVNVTPQAIDTTITVVDVEGDGFKSVVISGLDGTDRVSFLILSDPGAAATGTVWRDGNTIKYRNAGVWEEIATVSGGVGNDLVITFETTPVVDATRVAAVLGALSYASIDDSPESPSDARTLTYTLTDNNNSTATATVTITVTPENDAPTLSGSATPLVLPENTLNDTPAVIDGTITYSDVDEPVDLDGGTLTLSLSGITSDDILSVGTGGDFSLVDVLGTIEVHYLGTAIGTIDAGSSGANGESLAITFNSAATPANVQLLLRALTFQNTSNTPPAGARTLSIVVTDGYGGSTDTLATYDVSVTITAENDAPVVSDFDSTKSVQENASNLGAVVIDANVSVADDDTTIYDGGYVRVAIPTSAQDILSILSQGVGIGNIRLSSGNVQIDTTGDGSGWLTFGTVDGTDDGDGGSLQINLNGDATEARVNALLKRLSYQNTSDAPTDDRVLTLTVNDGEDTSLSHTMTLSVVAENDNPVLTGVVSPAAYNENTVNATPALIDSTVTFTDSDLVDFNNGTLTVTGVLTEDRISVQTQATVQRSGNDIQYDFGSGFVTIGTVDGTLDGNGKTLLITFNNVATQASIEAVIEALTYQNTSNSPTSSRGLAITVTDGDGGTTGAQNITVTVNPQVDLPVISGVTVGNQTIDDNQTATPFGAVVITDADSGTVSITITYTAANGVFSNASFLGFVGTAGSYTLSGVTLAAATSALQALIFVPTINQVAVGSVVDTVFTLTANDATSGSSSDSDTTVRSLSVNDRPVLNPAAVDTNDVVEDAPAPVGAVGTEVLDLIELGTGNNVSDDDVDTDIGLAITSTVGAGTWYYSTNNGASWTVLGAVSGTSARVLFATAGTRVYYRPAADENGAVASFNFVAFDRSDAGITNGGAANTTLGTAFSTGSATARTFVTEVNDAPQDGDDGLAAVNEDAPAYTVTVASLLANDDPGPDNESGQTVTFVGLTGTPTGVTVSESGGIITITLNANFNGIASFQYQVIDNGTTNGTSDPEVATFTVTFTVNSVNDAPVATDDSYLATEDTTLNGSSVLANDSDLHASAPSENNVALTAVLVSGPTNASSFTLNPDGTFTYTPVANFNGNDSFTYQAIDTLSGVSNTVTVTIAVAAVNDPPTFVLPDGGTPGNASTTSPEDGAAVTVPNWATGISAGPGEGSQNLQFNVTTNHDSWFTTVPAINPTTGALTYHVAPDAHGTVTVTVVLVDDGGTDFGGDDTSITQTFTIVISPINDKPTVTADQTLEVLEDATPVSIPGWATFDAGENETDGVDQYEVLIDSPNAAYFAVPPAVANDGTLTYTLADDVHGTVTFQVRVIDDGGNDSLNGDVNTSDYITVTLTITPVNDPPTFVLPDGGTPGNASTTSPEDGAAVTVPNWATGISAGPGEGSQNLQFNVTTDNDSWFTTVPAINPTTGALTYEVAPDAHGTVTVTVVLVDDGGTADGGDDTSITQTFTIVISPVNDKPTVTADQTLEVLEDAMPVSIPGWASFDPGANETDGVDQYEVLIDSPNAAYFAVPPAVANDGTLTYTLADDVYGTVTFQVRVIDDGGNDSLNGDVNTSDYITVTLTITPVNDPPTFVLPDGGTPGAAVHTSAEDGGAVSVPGWASSISAGPFETGQVLKFNILSNSNPALFATQPAIDVNGRLTYTAAANAFGTATIVVQLIDDGGTPSDLLDDQFSTQTFTIEITPVNDAPSFDVNLGNVTSNEDAGPQSNLGVLNNISAGPTNEAAQTVSFNIVSVVQTSGNVSFSAIAIDSNGNLTYTAASNVSGVATIVVQAEDNGALPGNNLSGTKTFTITINAVADAPTLVVTPPASGTYNEGAVESFGITPTLNDTDGSEQLAYITITGIQPGVQFLVNGMPVGVVSGGTLTLTPAQLAGLTVRFADNGTYSFTVTATSIEGSNSNTATSTPQTFNFAVANVAPTIAVSGDAAVDENDLYTLILGAVTDPGTDTVTIYAIDWGDGSPLEFHSTAGAKTHYYADGTSTHNIRVHLTDEDGTFNNAGGHSVLVVNVPPVLLGLPTEVSLLEGDPLALGPIGFFDQGRETNFTLVIRFNDRFDIPGLTTTSISFTPGGPGVYSSGEISFSHTYIEPGIYLVQVQIVDEDGAASETAMIRVAIVDQIGQAFDLVEVSADVEISLPPTVANTFVQSQEITVGSNQQSNDAFVGQGGSAPAAAVNENTKILKVVVRIDRLQAAHGAVTKNVFAAIVSSNQLSEAFQVLETLPSGIYRVTITADGLSSQATELELTNFNKKQLLQVITGLLQGLQDDEDQGEVFQGAIYAPADPAPSPAPASESTESNTTAASPVFDPEQMFAEYSEAEELGRSNWNRWEAALQDFPVEEWLERTPNEVNRRRSHSVTEELPAATLPAGGDGLSPTPGSEVAGDPKLEEFLLGATALAAASWAVPSRVRASRSGEHTARQN